MAMEGILHFLYIIYTAYTNYTINITPSIQYIIQWGGITSYCPVAEIEQPSITSHLSIAQQKCNRHRRKTD